MGDLEQRDTLRARTVLQKKQFRGVAGVSLFPPKRGRGRCRFQGAVTGQTSAGSSMKSNRCSGCCKAGRARPEPCAGNLAAWTPPLLPAQHTECPSSSPTPQGWPLGSHTSAHTHAHAHCTHRAPKGISGPSLGKKLFTSSVKGEADRLGQGGENMGTFSSPPAPT